MKKFIKTLFFIPVAFIFSLLIAFMAFLLILDEVK